MAINFIPLDPLAHPVGTLRRKQPRPGRKRHEADFKFVGKVSELVYAPDTPEFLFWQSREAALAALETWDRIAGSPLLRWYGNKRLLLLRNQSWGYPDAAYERNRTVTFYEYAEDGQRTRTGASTEIVAHEVGHALLDALRPDLWTDRPEVAAFHEAFGDCWALLTVLSDRKTRLQVLAASPDLGKDNPVATLFADLAAGIKHYQTKYPPVDGSSVPRQVFNRFQWTLPQAPLLAVAPPGQLSLKSHIFGQIFVGCFYDTLRNIFTSQPKRDQAGLWQAAITAGRLLVEGTRIANLEDRFFQSVGKAMIVFDSVVEGGANALSVRKAFADHNIALDSSTMLAPVAGLAGRTFHPESSGPAVSRITCKDLKQRLHAETGARLALSAVRIAERLLVKASHQREICLGKLDKQLEGVICCATESVLVGPEEGRPALLGRIPDSIGTRNEILDFIRTLLDAGQIHMGGKRAGKFGSCGPLATHTVVRRGAKRVLLRTRFNCVHGS